MNYVVKFKTKRFEILKFSIYAITLNGRHTKMRCIVSNYNWILFNEPDDFWTLELLVLTFYYLKKYKLNDSENADDKLKVLAQLKMKSILTVKLRGKIQLFASTSILNRIIFIDKRWQKNYCYENDNGLATIFEMIDLWFCLNWISRLGRLVSASQGLGTVFWVVHRTWETGCFLQFN